jgi:hypothetical protein
MKHTAVSLIGVASVCTSFLASAPASAALRHRPSFIKLYNYDRLYNFQCLIASIVSRVPQCSTMPGVPSGRGCDACRKQKKKVRPHQHHTAGLSIDRVIVRHSATIVFKMQKTRARLYRRWTASLQIHSSGRLDRVEKIEYAADI